MMKKADPPRWRAVVQQISSNCGLAARRNALPAKALRLACSKRHGSIAAPRMPGILAEEIRQGRQEVRMMKLDRRTPAGCPPLLLSAESPAWADSVARLVDVLLGIRPDILAWHETDIASLVEKLRAMSQERQPAICILRCTGAPAEAAHEASRRMIRLRNAACALWGGPTLVVLPNQESCETADQIEPFRIDRWRLPQHKCIAEPLHAESLLQGLKSSRSLAGHEWYEWWTRMNVGKALRIAASPSTAGLSARDAAAKIVSLLEGRCDSVFTHVHAHDLKRLLVEPLPSTEDQAARFLDQVIEILEADAGVTEWPSH